MIATILTTWSLLQWRIGSDSRVHETVKGIATRAECVRVATTLGLEQGRFACAEMKTVVYLPAKH